MVSIAPTTPKYFNLFITRPLKNLDTEVYIEEKIPNIFCVFGYVKRFFENYDMSYSEMDIQSVFDLAIKKLQTNSNRSGTVDLVSDYPINDNSVFVSVVAVFSD